MYRAKASGRNTIARFDPTMQEEVARTAAMHAKVRQAIVGGALDLHLQPLVRATDGRPVGAEALLRWFEPGCDAVWSDRLVEAAEQIGMADALEARVLELAADVLRR